jgi:hypothetical protein
VDFDTKLTVTFDKNSTNSETTKTVLMERKKETAKNVSRYEIVN